MHIDLLLTLGKMYIMAKSRNLNLAGDSFYSLMNNDPYEGAMIAPTSQVISTFYTNFFMPLRHALFGLQNNISFLYADLGKNLEIFKINCDWCSVCNGIIHTAITNVARNPELRNRINYNKLKIVSHFLDACLANRTNKVLPEKIAAHARATFGSSTRGLYMLSKIYLQLEQVELRWCPFKRSKDFYYRNSDPRYITPDLQNIYTIGKLLSQHETVSCENCPVLINSRLKLKRETSLFQPFLDLMIENL